MTTWFISDLHLEAANTGVTQQLLAFLTQLKGNAEALYILGDLFEYWVGDDVLDSSYATAFQPVVRALHQLTEQGVKLYFQHGNRDFLLGERFAAATGCILLPEQQQISLYGKQVLLLHGDTLCTDDVEYQRVRAYLRSEQWRAQFLALPLAERIRQAEAMREQSRQSMQGRMAAILDVNPQAVYEVMQTQGVDCLIHGHTHRPAVHDLGAQGQRIVLGDWHADKASFLRVDAQGWYLNG